MTARGSGTRHDPCILKTAAGTSEDEMYRDPSTDPPAKICQVGSTRLSYQLRCIGDLHPMLVARGHCMDLGASDESKEPTLDTVEAWGRSPDDPVAGFYGLRKDNRGRFGMYVPPLPEALGMADLTHEKRNNRMRTL